MKIHPVLKDACLKDLKEFGKLSHALLMRRYRITFNLAEQIVKSIEDKNNARTSKLSKRKNA